MPLLVIMSAGPEIYKKILWCGIALMMDMSARERLDVRKILSFSTLSF